MGAQQSKDELLYQQASAGNVAGVKSLRDEGARLEWMDSEGRTPLILASMRPDLWHIAELLIHMGANVNAYRPGSHAGTPLHHAAKRGLEHTVNLLLSHGANPLMMNDDCHTALDLSRMKGHFSVVRTIENHVALFSGWLREVYGPSFLEALVPQWTTRKIWAVILPSGSRNPCRLDKLDLAIYPDLQAAQPRSTIALWKAHIEETKFDLPDPAVFITDKATKARYKLLSEKEDDKQQLLWFYNACKGTRQANLPIPAIAVGTPLPIQSQPNSQSSSSIPASEDAELAMAINASIQTAIAEGIPTARLPAFRTEVTNGWGSSSSGPTHNGWGPPVGAAAALPPQEAYLNQPDVPTAALPLAQGAVPAPSVPSAPPILADDDGAHYAGPISYPRIDSSPVSFPSSHPHPGPGGVKKGDNNSGDDAGLCVVCLDAPVEGACIPCGHLAGCMSCLNEIKAKKRECPVCRAEMSQVVKIYAV